MENKKPIKSFQDLDVYQTAYQGMLEVFKHILPKLPAEEKFDLVDQLRRSTKAIPRLISEGHSKRHQKRGFQKYLDDAMAESNETIVSITQAKDLYSSYIDITICEKLIDTYDKISRQCYNLAVAWSQFSERKKTQPNHDLRNEQRNRKT
ncbi:MAG: four helix bundle protein [Desulfobacteraceae bacterium]|jgi:four helix bundle protein